MIRHSNQFLEKCEKLKSFEVLFNFVPGVVVARGFADLGYEEFLLLENKKVISLYRGNVSDFEDSNNHFFRVPSTKDLRQKIFELEYEIEDIKFKLDVEATLSSPLGKKESFSSSNLDEMLLDMLISITNGDV